MLPSGRKAAQAHEGGAANPPVVRAGAALPRRSWARRFLDGMLAKDKSLATGLLVALIVWVMVRLINGVVGSGTIEYATSIDATTLADGSSGEKIEVELTNLSRETAVTNLQASISDPTGQLRFSTNPRDRACSFQPPAWGENPVCDPYSAGFTFSAPMLVPGTSARFHIKYRRADGAQAVRPVVRIKPDGSTKVRLIEPGIETFLARHETGLLLLVLAAAIALFAVSVAAGLSGGEQTQPKGNDLGK